MHLDQIVARLDNPQHATAWLLKLGIRDSQQAHQDLVSLAESGITLDLMADLAHQLEQWLPHTSDPDRVLHGLERFVRSARSPISLASLFERDRESLPTLLQLLSTSQYLADLLILDPASFDLLRLTEGSPVNRADLMDEICSEVESLVDETSVMYSLRQYKRREILRISYGDVIRGHDIDMVTEQLSYLADSICEAALRASLRSLTDKYGSPCDRAGQHVPVVVLALGKLGGSELNYSSDVDLVVLYGAEGRTTGPHKIDNAEFFERCIRTMVRLLSEVTTLGAVYRVDLRLRPYGKSGALAMSQSAAEHYYDTLGRTWERQAFVKARPIAGDLRLGQRFLDALAPWIYQRYLTRADISGIKALKRRIEHQSVASQTDQRNVKTGLGGIRDIEFVIQFLQLLNGGDLREIRTANTLDAIMRLESAGCLTMQERGLLEENYRFLRKTEHRLQIMFDLQTHTLPPNPVELRKLVLRMGYRDTTKQNVIEQFEHDFRHRTQVNRKILDHLLHDAFPDDDQTDPEADMILAPDPSPATLSSVLDKYHFQDVPAAYKHLTELAEESISFLSTRRCRHFLASIAHRLLPAIGATPDPDATLLELSRVSQSLGGKTVLWELFSEHAPSLHLYVRLCAGARYLSGILTSNPGMIDELLDSLTLTKLPTLPALRVSLNDLCRNADDLEPILSSFKNSYHLQLGVRDIVGRDEIDSIWGALSDVAETCLHAVVERELSRMVATYGQPFQEGQDQLGNPSELVVVALGKLGGREPNYHSDLDIMFVYSHEGTTRHPAGIKKQTTSNQHFFSELGQRIVKVINQVGPHGRLYELDLRLRPTGHNGPLAVSRPELLRYFTEGQGKLWEQQSLCRARTIYGSSEAAENVTECIHQCISIRPWQDSHRDSIREMRIRLQESAEPHNLKRGPGGTMDVEFLVQMLQLQYQATHPEILLPGTLPALTALADAACLPRGDAIALGDSYKFLRGVEAGLRLMNTTARHDLPQDIKTLRKLAYLLRLPNAESLLQQCHDSMALNRTHFDRMGR